jgi:serine/threonine transporter
MKTLKAVAARYNATSLILRIVIGLAVGAVLALAVPGAGWVEEFGSLFVGALKGIAPVLVFVIVASALAQGTSRLDRRFGTVIWLYMLTTFLAAAIAAATSFLFSQPTRIVDIGSLSVKPVHSDTFFVWLHITSYQQKFCISSLIRDIFG